MRKLLLFCILFPLYSAFTQTVDTTQAPSFFSGQITATNNGISLVPSFSLNKPAALFDLSMGKGRLSFDPMFRFGLDGKPWTFVFWFRYKLIANKKFSMGIGAHPAFLFRAETVTVNGISKELTTAQRYVAWEASPTYHLNKKVGLGLYYLGSHGLTKDLIQYGHFVAIKAIISNLKLTNQLNFSFVQQFYYLKQDQAAGTYFNASLGLAKTNLPVSISANISKTIKSEIKGRDFLWSIGLVYNINNKYFKNK